MHLAFDLGMDSLNIAELIMFVSKSYALEELHPEDLNTVHSVLEVAEGARGLTHAVRQGKFHWPLEKNRPHPAPPVGKTIPEAFLRSCDRMKNSMACADDLVGVLSYRKMKRSAIVLSFYFRKLPGAYVAVMLPASVGAYLAILAIQLAGKIPVMLNWTLGPRYLDEMMRATRAKTVISSWRFLERLSHVEFGSLIDKIELLEDTREKLSLGSKLKGALISLYSPSLILRSLHIDQIDENAQAVILFTSGTEANPKGVPLSHKNILSNQRSAMQCISLTKKDLLYGVLPPFHSFGFSVVGLFPICGGIKIAFYPDPTDGFAIAEGIERWKATLFCSPPTFLKGLLNAAKKEQLESIRLFVSGAEKAPLELFDRIKKLGTQGQLIEGYGITECSPIITISRLNLPHKGVGRPLPDIDICTIHLENQKLLPRGKEGEICVRGSNIFNGYLDSLRDPFIEIEGNEWYRTGDIGRLDEEGNLFLSGRIKRFTKIGGEMISLGSIEEALIKTFVESGKISADVPALALIVHEREQGQPQLILCSTVSIGREEVNQILQEVGFSHLVKISSVKKIEEIPLMGSGKIDYRRLESI
jgi:long-chain-fatty-acid--[acyl-carrier-protein] ligase